MILPEISPVFVGAAILLAVTPGPDTLFVAANSLAGGRRAGVIACLGTAVGNLGHCLAAAIGLSALIAASPAAFDVLRYLGAIYLGFIGLQALRAAWRNAHGGEERPAAGTLPRVRASDGAVFTRAMLTNLTNPKVIMFFVAFLPQFVTAAGSAAAIQTFALGVVLALIGTSWLLGVAALIGYLVERLARVRWVTTLLDTLSGLFFLGLAVKLLLTERRVG